MRDEDADELDLIFGALSDPTRRTILELLGGSPGLTTSELADRARGMTRWAVMKHLAVLRAAGLLQTFPDGRRRRHYREEARLRRARQWLDQL